jgi:hypothetical protein
MLYHETWSDYIDLEIFFELNPSIRGSAVELDTNETLEVSLPFSFHKTYGTDFNNISNDSFFLHLRLGYPHLNEDMVVELNKNNREKE